MALVAVVVAELVSGVVALLYTGEVVEVVGELWAWADLYSCVM
jgi:hypothetical protein